MQYTCSQELERIFQKKNIQCPHCNNKHDEFRNHFYVKIHLISFIMFDQHSDLQSITGYWINYIWRKMRNTVS